MSLQFSKEQVESSVVNSSKISIFAYSDAVFNLKSLEETIVIYYNKLKSSNWDKLRVQFNKQSNFSKLIKDIDEDLVGFKAIISLFLNKRELSFENIAIIYSHTNNVLLKNLLILLDLIRKYIVISLLSNMENDGETLFKGDTMDPKYGIIAAPGSSNITSDWDITFFLTIEGLNMFKICKISIPWLHSDQFTFCDLFDTIYPKYNEIFDNNLYFESCLNDDDTYTLPPYFEKLDTAAYAQLELEFLNTKENATNPENNVSLIKQIDNLISSLDHYIVAADFENSFRDYLQARVHKSEAYATYSAVLSVVVKNQLGIKGIETIIDKYPILYLISAAENALDLKNHIGKHEINKHSIKKYSKYLQRLANFLVKYNKLANKDLLKCMVTREVMTKFNDLVLLRAGKEKYDKTGTTNCTQSNYEECLNKLLDSLKIEINCITEGEANLYDSNFYDKLYQMLKSFTDSVKTGDSSVEETKPSVEETKGIYMNPMKIARTAIERVKPVLKSKLQTNSPSLTGISVKGGYSNRRNTMKRRNTMNY